MTTREKIVQLVDELKKAPPQDISGDVGGLVEMIQIAEGFGIDVFGALIPDTDAEADVMVDKLIALLFHLRGDDLPDFDLSLYGEAEEEKPAES